MKNPTKVYCKINGCLLSVSYDSVYQIKCHTAPYTGHTVLYDPKTQEVHGPQEMMKLVQHMPVWPFIAARTPDPIPEDVPRLVAEHSVKIMKELAEQQGYEVRKKPAPDNPVLPVTHDATHIPIAQISNHWTACVTEIGVGPVNLRCVMHPETVADMRHLFLSDQMFMRLTPDGLEITGVKVVEDQHMSIAHWRFERA